MFFWLSFATYRSAAWSQSNLLLCWCVFKPDSACTERNQLKGRRQWQPDRGRTVVALLFAPRLNAVYAWSIRCSAGLTSPPSTLGSRDHSCFRTPQRHAHIVHKSLLHEEVHMNVVGHLAARRCLSYPMRFSTSTIAGGRRWSSRYRV